jgi:hypothetical protein
MRRTRRSPCRVAASSGGKGRDAGATQALGPEDAAHRFPEEAFGPSIARQGGRRILPKYASATEPGMECVCAI